MLSIPVDFRCTLGVLSPDPENRMYTAVLRGSFTMMRIWLIAVMILLALIAADITVRIGWGRLISGIGTLVDGQRHAEQVSPGTAQPRTPPPQQKPLPPAPVPTLTPEGK